MANIIVENETKQYIVVRLGGEQYGIDIRYIDNITRMMKITRVPKIQSYFKGVINLRGEIVPVMSIRTKMGLSEDEITNNSRIIILKIEEQGMFGIIVDEVKEVVNLAADDIDKVGHDIRDEKANFINGVGKHGGGLISLLDLNSVIDEREVV